MKNVTNEFVEYINRKADTEIRRLEDLRSESVDAVLSAVGPYLTDQGGKHGVWTNAFLEASAAIRSNDKAGYERLSQGVKERLTARKHREWEREVRSTEESLCEEGSDDQELFVEGDRRFRRGDDAELALHLVAGIEDDVTEELGGNEQLAVSPVTTDGGELLRYRGCGEDRGIWSPIPDQNLSSRIQDWSGAPVGAEEPRPLRIHRSRVTGAIQCAKDKCHDPEFFQEGPDAVGFEDVVIRIGVSDNLDIREHGPENRLRHKVPVELGPAIEDYERLKDTESLTQRRFFRYLSEVFAPDEDEDQKVDTLAEFTGATLFGRATDFQTALVLFGEGANGKSVFLKVLRRLFPEEWVCSIAPQHLDDNFKKAALGGKRLNIVNEMSDKFIRHSADVKEVIDGHTYTASRKNKPERSYEACAGHIFAANTLPRVRDTTDGFWRAFMPITFNRQFEEHEKDPNLVEKVVEDLPLVAAWAVEGLQRLLRRGQYTVPPSSRAKKEEWRDTSNSVRLFVSEFCSEVDGVSEDTPGTETTNLYKAYEAWCWDFGHKKVALNTFGQRLSQMGYGSTRMSIDGKQKTRRPLNVDGSD